MNAITACARMAEARTRWESHPAMSMRSAARYLRQADGAVRLRVTNTVAMSPKELAAKLFEHYAVPYQQGAELPKELEFSELLHALAFHAEQCAFGHHHWAEDVNEVEDDVREWAAAQVQRLLPYLTEKQTD
ncbi:hypothetical protein [Kitasatospora sp. NPDC088134]|uniref:hypothetical protein n=1 Tax=Kitasatospora sp. NPDC088134 TaxID=3364071 RepID=UPI003827834A